MDQQSLLIIITTSVVFMLVIVGGSLLMYTRFFRRVQTNQALVVTTPRGPIVVLSGGMLVYPVFNTVEVIDLSFRTLNVELKQVPTKDDALVDVTASFRLRVNANEEDVLKVSRAVGCARAVDPTALRELFGARCTNALRAAVRQLTRAALNDQLEDRALEKLGPALSGYVADGVGIESVA